MQGISCFINFKENLSKNAPYYNLLIRQIDGSGSETPAQNLWIGEQAALSGGTCGSIVSKICEGYQFTIAFSGRLLGTDALKKELCSFGYHFLSDKDAELALLSYIHFGEKCSGRLAGSFSFIIYDAMRRQVFALCDKDTEMPLFYGKTKDGYVLSSSIKGIFACPGTSKSLSRQSVLDLLYAQNRIPHRIFEDVYILPPKHSLKISLAGICEKECSLLPEDAGTDSMDIPHDKNYGVIWADTVLDAAVLERLLKMRQKNQERISVYAEKFPEEIRKSPARLQSISVDDGAVYYGLESSVAACGFPVLSDHDYLLPLAVRRAKGNGETLCFAAPDRFSPYKNYISTLIKNDAFYRPIEKNLATHTKADGFFLCYPTLIADFFDVKIKTPVFYNTAQYNKEETQASCSKSSAVKTALRHILLDIISKEYSPIIAFFKRSALLRLCEGGFSFLPGQSECELIAYLIKLNMWFEMYRPRII